MHLLAWVLVWVCCAAVALWSLVALPLSAIFGTGNIVAAEVPVRREQILSGQFQ